MTVEKLWAIFLVISAGLVFSASEARACSDLGFPEISVAQYTGEFYMSQEKTAFMIAREKSERYDIKMPVRQGNMGQTVFREKMEINLKSYPSAGCIAVQAIDVKVYVDQKIEIAREHGEGSCMYNELYNLEIELMQQDEGIINTNLEKLTDNLKQTVGIYSASKFAVGMNVDMALYKRKEEIKALIRMYLDVLEGELLMVRRDTDLLQYYAEIEADCSGG